MTQTEIEWLDVVCEAAADKTPTRGVIDALKEEIDRHKVELVMMGPVFNGQSILPL